MAEGILNILQVDEDTGDLQVSRTIKEQIDDEVVFCLMSKPGIIPGSPTLGIGLEPFVPMHYATLYADMILTDLPRQIPAIKEIRNMSLERIGESQIQMSFIYILQKGGMGYYSTKFKEIVS